MNSADFEKGIYIRDLIREANELAGKINQFNQEFEAAHDRKRELANEPTRTET